MAAGAGVGTRLLTHSFPSPRWHGCSEARAKSGDGETGAAKWGNDRGAAENERGNDGGGIGGPEEKERPSRSSRD